MINLPNNNVYKTYSRTDAQHNKVMSSVYAENVANHNSWIKNLSTCSQKQITPADYRLDIALGNFFNN